MKDRLVILGAGGHGKVCADIAIAMKLWKDIIFLDDNTKLTGCLSFPVRGILADTEKYRQDSDFFIALGENKVRENQQKVLEKTGASVVRLIHPKAVIGTDVLIGTGTAVMAGTVINSSSKIGKGCIVNTASSVDHDVVLDDYVHISPGTHLAGNVRVGKRSWLGIGSIISNHITICGDCQTGAGTVVVKDLWNSGLYVGVPAMLMEKKLTESR